MSSYFKLEIVRLQNDEVALNYWDSMHGKDVVIILRDNKAYRRVWDDVGKDQLQMREFEVDLMQTLLTLAARLYPDGGARDGG